MRQLEHSVDAKRTVNALKPSCTSYTVQCIASVNVSKKVFPGTAEDSHWGTVWEWGWFSKGRSHSEPT